MQSTICKEFEKIKIFEQKKERLVRPIKTINKSKNLC